MSDAAMLHHPPLLRGWSHLVSFVAMAVLGAVMIAAAGSRHTLLVTYIAGVLAMFGVSAGYHRVPWSPPARSVMRRLDHSTIFLAIAGTYTPIAAVCLYGWSKPAVLGAAWGGAAVGIGLQWLPIAVPRQLSAAIYVVVGWSAGLAMPQLFHGMGALGFSFVIAGGVSYTVGAVVYALRRPDPWPRVFGFHEVFHLLTVVGAGLHVAAIAFTVLPRL